MGTLTNLLVTAICFGAVVTIMHPVKGAPFRDAVKVGSLTAGLSFTVWGGAIALFK